MTIQFREEQLRVETIMNAQNEMIELPSLAINKSLAAINGRMI
jgi:hypothetical protein